MLEIIKCWTYVDSHSTRWRTLHPTTEQYVDAREGDWFVSLAFDAENLTVYVRHASWRDPWSWEGLPFDGTTPGALERALEMGNAHLAKASRGKAGKPLDSAQLPQSFERDYPILSAFLSEDQDADDKPRDRSKLTLFLDATGLKAALTDPTREASLYVTISAPGDAFRALERALQEDEPDWRAWAGGKKKKR